MQRPPMELLRTLAKSYNAKVHGAERVSNPAHAHLIATAILAFGEHPDAYFYIEGLPPFGNIPRPDLIILHPALGVLVIENKGLPLSALLAVQNTQLTIERNGIARPEDPFVQAEKVMYRLKDLSRHRLDVAQAIFLRTASLPQVSLAAFTAKFQVAWPAETVFQEHLSRPDVFRAHITAYADREKARAGRQVKLTADGRRAIIDILHGRGFLQGSRTIRVADNDPNHMGMQVQQLELATKRPTSQQLQLGTADYRGQHRLFRGVAGSGKSVMLALNVAYLLTRFAAEDTEQLFSQKSDRPKRVLVVCFNRSLVPYLRQKIDDCYGRLAWAPVPEDRVTVTHFEGLVRDLESKVPALATGLGFDQEETRARAMLTKFDTLAVAVREKVVYDAVYVDEGQDLAPAEFELLLRLARKDENGDQTFLVFYDNAQNIYGATTPVWDKIGIKIIGRTAYMDQCFRNTKETLELPFNVLVGSFAPEKVRVTTRQFADVAGLRQRGLIIPNGDRFDVNFAPRRGPAPVVTVYPFRNAEMDGVVEEVKRLIQVEQVLPGDILILYKSAMDFGPRLIDGLQKTVGAEFSLRLVDPDHRENKNLPLVEEGVMTVSTVHSAKGYDAPIVFVLGVDEFDSDTAGRAMFYVGATRAKLKLYVSGIKRRYPTLLDEVNAAFTALQCRTGVSVTPPPVVAPPPAMAKGSTVPPAAPVVPTAPKCRHCGSTMLHAQYGKWGYFYRCIECTQNTPIDETCPTCKKKGRIRKEGLSFFRECEACGASHVVHRNVRLGSLESPND